VVRNHELHQSAPQVTSVDSEPSLYSRKSQEELHPMFRVKRSAQPRELGNYKDQLMLRHSKTICCFRRSTRRSSAAVTADAMTGRREANQNMQMGNKIGSGGGMRRSGTEEYVNELAGTVDFAHAELFSGFHPRLYSSAYFEMNFLAEDDDEDFHARD
jgi:hypothetical protein